MNRYHCGIDPGKTGAIAVLDLQTPEGQPPLLTALFKANATNLANTIILLDSLCIMERTTARVLCEKERAHPYDTPKTAFGLGRVYGLIEGAFHFAKVQAKIEDRPLKRTFDYVEPTKWQGAQFLGLSRSENDTKELAALHVRRVWQDNTHLIQGHIGDIPGKGGVFPEYCVDAICIALHSTGYKYPL